MPKKNVARPVFPSPANGKRRADELVFRQGLAESREQAQRLIMAGKVFLAPTEEETAGGKPPFPGGQAGEAVPARYVFSAERGGAFRKPGSLQAADRH